jgi:hypothetical protein
VGEPLIGESLLPVRERLALLGAVRADVAGAVAHPGAVAGCAYAAGLAGGIGFGLVPPVLDVACHQAVVLSTCGRESRTGGSPCCVVGVRLGGGGVGVHRTTFTADGTVVEFALGVHAATRFSWTYDFKVPDSAAEGGDKK